MQYLKLARVENGMNAYFITSYVVIVVLLTLIMFNVFLPKLIETMLLIFIQYASHTKLVVSVS